MLTFLQAAADLAPPALAPVRALIAEATRVDGVAPLNERAQMNLSEAAVHVVAWATDAAEGIENEVVAYGQVDPTDLTAQLVVAPDRRRRGVGRSIVDLLAADHPGARFWAFGDLPPAQGLAAATGRTAVRELLIMERPLTDVPQPDPQANVTLRPYEPADADAMVAVNAAAFASHPEQGAMDRADLDRRLVDPSDIVLAVDAVSDRVLGFHWTKRHGDGLGEVYVIGVAPDAAGRGLGRTLLWAGLGHLARSGCHRVILYVEGDNHRAVSLYEASGFVVVHRDVLYGKKNEGGGS